MSKKKKGAVKEKQASTPGHGSSRRNKPSLLLREALDASPFLHRAGRPYSPGIVLVSDGVRFWTSDDKFQGMYVSEFDYPTDKEKTVDKIWRPVLGDESGWRLA